MEYGNEQIRNTEAEREVMQLSSKTCVKLARYLLVAEGNHVDVHDEFACMCEEAVRTLAPFVQEEDMPEFQAIVNTEQPPTGYRYFGAVRASVTNAYVDRLQAGPIKA